MTKFKKCINNCIYYNKTTWFCSFKENYLWSDSNFCNDWIDKKDKTKEWNNVPFKTWEYEEQTEMKHKILNWYFNSWWIILWKYNKKLNFFDWFWWIWAYHKKEEDINNIYLSKNYWSTIIADKHLSNLLFSKKIWNWNIIVIDQNEDNLNNIKEVIKYLKLDRHSNLNIITINWDFDNEINKFLDKNLAPSFFFIDPFWFKIKFETLKRIMSLNKSEIFLNFMFNSINRHISNNSDDIIEIMDNYFWCKDWEKAKNLNWLERENFIINLFRKQCKTISKFVYPFKLKFPNKDRTYYYLFHLTNYYLGIKIMKDVFSKNNLWELEYSWNKTDKAQIWLFDNQIQDDRKSLFIEMLKDKYLNSSFTYLNILEDFIDEIDFTEKWIKSILKELEDINKIKITPFDWRKRRWGYEEKDIIIFTNN
jgi:three-Cys-motif partner protein